MARRISSWRVGRWALPATRHALAPFAGQAFQLRGRGPVWQVTRPPRYRLEAGRGGLEGCAAGRAPTVLGTSVGAPRTFGFAKRSRGGARLGRRTRKTDQLTGNPGT